VAEGLPIPRTIRKVRQMASRPRYTTQQMIDALTATRGLVYLAAQRLQCDPDTVMNYCKKYPSVEAAKQQARGALLDMAEAKLFLAVQRNEPWAITFCLKTIGRSRGYGERLDLSVSIQAAAARVADEFGLSVQEVLQEAKVLLMEVDNGA
jgi:hypothetical protein